MVAPPLLTPAPATPARTRRAARRAGGSVPLRVLPAALLTGAVATGVVVGALAAGGRAALALVFPVLLLPVLVWVRPSSGVYLVFGATVVIEQFEYPVGPRDGAVTARLPFFHSVSAGSGIIPVELVLGLVVLVWVLRTEQARGALLPRSRMLAALGALFGLSLVYLAVGVGRHGDLRAALWEVKPLLYLSILFVLASSLITTREAVRALLWTLVVGTGLKAAYGLVIFLSVRHVQPRPEAVLAHEESFFFGLEIVLTLGLWTFGVRGRLRAAATVVFPVVLLADMANSRRTAWAILMFTIVLMLVISYVRVPERRRGVRRIVIVAAAIAAVYFPVFWNGTGALAQPARAVHSQIAPDARDASSDEYRVLEDQNLELNIRATHSLGAGYGVPIDYVIAIPDLTGVSSMLAYVPHDGVLWIWLRLGVLGEAMFWLVVAYAVVAACRLSADPDRETGAFGALAACAVLAWVVIGEKDLGFFWFRIACFMGVLLGAVHARSTHGAVRRRPA